MPLVRKRQRLELNEDTHVRVKRVDANQPGTDLDGERKRGTARSEGAAAVRGYDARETHPAHADGNEPEGHTMGEAWRDGNGRDSPEDLTEWASRLAEGGAGIREYAG